MTMFPLHFSPSPLYQFPLQPSIPNAQRLISGLAHSLLPPYDKKLTYAEAEELGRMKRELDCIEKIEKLLEFTSEFIINSTEGNLLEGRMHTIADIYRPAILDILRRTILVDGKFPVAEEFEDPDVKEAIKLLKAESPHTFLPADETPIGKKSLEWDSLKPDVKGLIDSPSDEFAKQVFEGEEPQQIGECK